MDQIRTVFVFLACCPEGGKLKPQLKVLMKEIRADYQAGLVGPGAGEAAGKHGRMQS